MGIKHSHVYARQASTTHWTIPSAGLLAFLTRILKAKEKEKLDTMIHAGNASTKEAEAGALPQFDDRISLYQLNFLSGVINIQQLVRL